MIMPSNKAWQVHDVNVLRCRGDLNANSMVEVKQAVTKLIHHKHRKVILDMAKAERADLAGLGILIERLKLVRSLHGDIKLCNLRPQVSETLRMVGVSKLIDSYASEEEAMKSFQFA